MNTSRQKKPVVLIVDDAIESIHMLNDVLEESGFTVLVALEGNQALMIARNIRPDIILLDAIMPHMDGFETCRKLKQNPTVADVPVIFMTGLTDTGHIVAGLQAGGVDYMPKPINPEELIARMRVHLDNAHHAKRIRDALDTAGQYLLATDDSGAMQWATPQVYNLLQQTGTGLTVLETALRQWLTHLPAFGQQLDLRHQGIALKLEYLAFPDEREHLFRASESLAVAGATDTLKHQFAVTVREADVLLWIAHGKTNREIGQILEMSPRTVNKHLEQIFRKLGVENRTSAAAVALRYIKAG